MSRTFRVIVLAAALSLTPMGRGAAAGAVGDSAAPAGAFTCDFGIGPGALTQDLAAVIERDRIYMARRPGMVDKHLPLVVDAKTQSVRSGGRYLFDTYAHAQDYFNWVVNDFVLDGTHFLQRPYFQDPDCRPWVTVGARDFSPVNANRVAMRTERWQLPMDQGLAALQGGWPSVRAEAQRRGLAAVWMLFDPTTNVAEIVSYAERALPLPGTDVVAFVKLLLAPTMDAIVAGAGWVKSMDLTEFVLTIWFPNTATGDGGRASLWPNSPLLPQPSAVDGVCEPSRGETRSSAPLDCSAQCGDGAQQAAENNKRCPSDVAAF